MNTYLLLIEMAISVAASLAVLRALATPLVRALEKICPDEASAGFWLSYSQVVLVIVPLILVLLMGWIARYGSAQESLRMAMLATLVGLLLGLQRIGARLLRFIPLPGQPGSEK